MRESMRKRSRRDGGMAVSQPGGIGRPGLGHCDAVVDGDTVMGTPSRCLVGILWPDATLRPIITIHVAVSMI
jgi:hypothetical protein